MYDFNQEEDQQARASGPIPAGSSVMVRLSIRRPKFTDGNSEFIGKTTKGMLFLDAEYEVLGGQFQGCKIWEYLWLPLGLQRASLTDGQKKACTIAAQKMKGILNAAYGLMPKDDSPQANRKRNTQSWLDFNGLEFPVAVGIKDDPSESNGKTYWNNTISRIVTPDDKRYDDLLRIGEIITDGPVVGKGTATQRTGNSGDPGYEQAPASAYDDTVPF